VPRLVTSFASTTGAAGDDRRMSLETEAVRRCERLLVLLTRAMAMERALGERGAELDSSTRSVVRPILDDALARLEPLLAPRADRSLADCVRELVDLELELDAAFARRGWRVIDDGHDAPPASDPA
jgi:hypothetical protein